MAYKSKLKANGSTVAHRQSVRRTPEYAAWLNMRARCLDDNTSYYNNYGARGISICEEWLGSFDTFLADMGTRPDGHSLDRIDNSEGYSPGNCRWATRKEQQNNTRRNVLVVYGGRTQNIKQWSEELGINYRTLYQRIRCYGWSVEKAFGVSA